MTEQTYETDTFNRYIPLSEAAAVFQLLNELHDQIKKKPLSELPYYELEDEVCIDDVDTIKAYMEEHPDFFIDAPLFIIFINHYLCCLSLYIRIDPNNNLVFLKFL